MKQRVLIIGSGSIGQRYRDFLKDEIPKGFLRILKRSNVHESNSLSTFTTLDSAIEFQPQIAVIANPSSLHSETALIFADIGTHLLIEKPISNTKKDLTKLFELCDSKNLRLLVGYNLRFLPSLNYFKNLYEQGAAGNVLSVRCEVGQYLPDWRSGKDYRESVSAKSELGGGVLLELSHEIDYLRWIFGEIEWVMASATQQSKLEIDVEDQALIILGFKSSTNSSQLIGSLGMDFIRHDKTRTCTVVGEETSICWDGVKGTVEVFDRANQIWQVVFEQSGEIEESYKAEWLELINSIEENRDPCVTGWDGLIVLEIIEAIRASASSKQRMIVNYEESNSRNR
jgi:predicted dehydrogenase